jgi:structural maintenance of chromosome 4
LSRRLLTPFV